MPCQPAANQDVPSASMKPRTMRDQPGDDVRLSVDQASDIVDHLARAEHQLVELRRDAIAGSDRAVVRSELDAAIQELQAAAWSTVVTREGHL